MSGTQQVVVRGGGFFGFLTLLLTGLFVAGKIFGFLAWSWWMVFLPLLIYMGLVIGVPLVLVALVAIVGLVVVAAYVLFLVLLAVFKAIKRKLA